VWLAIECDEALADPPRPTIRWIPEDGNEPPGELLDTGSDEDEDDDDLDDEELDQITEQEIERLLGPDFASGLLDSDDGNDTQESDDFPDEEKNQ
jgi:hypothetical protein